MKQALKALIHEMEYVLSCINADKVPFDGDDFHEALRLGKEALAQPEQEPVAWKLVPVEPTEKMLKAMDECSKEGYDERLYACHAASVYMAAVDVAPTPPQRKPLDMFEVETLAKQCGLEWSTKIQNLCDMVALSVDTDDISSERVDKEDENVHDHAWLSRGIREVIVRSEMDEKDVTVNINWDYSALKEDSTQDNTATEVYHSRATEEEPVAWLCKRKDGHFDVLTDQTCKKCFPVYTHPQKIGMTDEDFKNDRYA